MQKNTFFRLVVTCLVFVCFTLQAQAKPVRSNPVKDTLVVGVAGSAPFVIQNKDTNKPEGIAVNIWEDLADKKEWSYRYKSFKTVEDALNAVKRGSLDLVVGPISITAKRLEQMNFSQPYYQSSLSIASREDDISLWSTVKTLFSFKLLVAVGVFLFILAVVGTLLWFAEHKESPEQFPSDPVKGIGNGMWLAIVTMSTTGYGDMAPITLRGRIVAGVWMVITLIFATSMVAGIASTLTLSGMGTSTIKNIEELSNKKTATISGSPAVPFIKEHRSKAVTVNTLPQAMDKLANKQVDAVLYDRPQILYYEKNSKTEDFYIAKAEYYKQGYGFAFPPDSKLVNTTNLSLLKLAEDQRVAEIVEYYLGSEQ